MRLELIGCAIEIRQPIHLNMNKSKHLTCHGAVNLLFFSVK